MKPHVEQVTSFPATAVGPMLEGYCDDFVSFAASLAQTLEQVKMRRLPYAANCASLARVERGMRDLAEAIGSLLAAAPSASPAPPAASAATPPPPAAPARRTCRSAPPTADATPAGKVVMQGSTDDLPIASVFQFLGQTRKSGVLRVRAGGETVSFTLNAGKIEATATDQPPAAERLGDLLLELGMLQRHQIEALIVEGQLLGSELLKAGLVSNEQLLQALRLQMQRRYQRVAAARPATYTFYEALATEVAGRVRVSAGELRSSGRTPQAAAPKPGA